MNPIKPKQDIVPLSKFRAHVTEYLSRVREFNRPIIVTQHGEARGVFLAIEEYETLQETIETLRNAGRGLNDIIAGRTTSHEGAKKRLRASLKAIVARSESENKARRISA